MTTAAIRMQPRGPRGVGLAPEHEVSDDGLRIRFKNPDGSWGDWIVLPPGPEGPAGDAQTFASIGQLQASSIGAGVRGVTVLGFSAPGDTGGPQFYKTVDAAPTHPGKVDSVNGVHFEIVSRFVDVRTRGLYHNTVNDTALREAREIAEALGVPLRVPKDFTALVGSDQDLFCQSAINFIIEGEDRNSSLIKAANGAQLDSIIATTSAPLSTTLRNLRISGNKQNNGTHPSSSSYGAQLQSNNTEVDHCIVEDCWRVGLAFGAMVGLTIKDSIIRDNEVIGIYGLGPLFKVCFEDNSFERNYKRALISDSGAFGLTLSDFKISRNDFIDNYNTNGGQFEAGDGGSGSSGINGVIESNRIWQTGTVAGEHTFGFSVYGSDVLVCDNTVGIAGRAVTGPGIVTGGDNYGVTIASNKIWASGQAINLTIGDGSIGTRRSSVIGNHILAGSVGVAYQAASSAGNDVAVLSNYIDPGGVTTRYAGLANFSMVHGNYPGDTN